MRRTICIQVLTIATVVGLIPNGLGGAAAAPPAKAEPLYLLTYDHGGLVLWGHDHFAERLSNAVSWLDKYPSFKIGLDNEAHTYNMLAEHNPKLLNELFCRKFHSFSSLQ